MNEKMTERELIEPSLEASGWGKVEGSKIFKGWSINQGRLLGNGRKARPLEADYILFYRNKKLAVIEAKRSDISYREGRGQAIDYARRLNIKYTYATNGHKIYQINMESAKEGEVNKYPTPDQLWEMTYPDENEQRDKFNSIPFESKGGKWKPRYYQENALNTLVAITA